MLRIGKGYLYLRMRAVYRIGIGKGVGVNDKVHINLYVSVVFRNTIGAYWCSPFARSVYLSDSMLTIGN